MLPFAPGVRAFADECHDTFLVYLLTFNCYGTHLRGDESGSVDRARNVRGGVMEPAPALVNYGQHVMKHPAVVLGLEDSLQVLKAIQETCVFRRWTLIAAHIRSSHVHLVVDGISDVPDALRDFKCNASRVLNQGGTGRWWARGGNARPLRDRRAVHAAIRYVADQQGVPMALYVASGV